jgi:hypothetical protein
LSRRPLKSFSSANARHGLVSPRSSPVIQAQSWPAKSDAWRGCATRACCIETFGNVFDRWISFDHAVRTNFARPSSFIPLRDLTAMATSDGKRSFPRKLKHRSLVCSECEVRLHNRSERALARLVHGRLRNIK